MIQLQDNLLRRVVSMAALRSRIKDQRSLDEDDEKKVIGNFYKGRFCAMMGQKPDWNCTGYYEINENEVE